MLINMKDSTRLSGTLVLHHGITRSYAVAIRVRRECTLAVTLVCDLMWFYGAHIAVLCHDLQRALVHLDNDTHSMETRLEDSVNGPKFALNTYSS